MDHVFKHMGNSMKTVIGLVIAVVVLFVIRIAISTTNRPNDQQLIETALKEAIAASKEGKAGGVLDLLSKDIKVNDQSGSGNLRQVADFVQKQKPDVNVTNLRAQITGDEGRIVSPVELDLGLLGKRTLKEVTMIFRKEDATEYLVIPTTKWHLAEVRVPETTISDILQ